MANLRDFKLDDSGDLVIAGGRIQTVSAYDEVAQNVQTIIGTELGSAYLAEELGVSYDSLLGKGFNEHFAEQDIMDAVTMQEPRVTAVDEVTFSLDPETRALTIKLKLEADLEQSGDTEDYEMEVSLDASD